jgi:hypothetical protein
MTTVTRIVRGKYYDGVTSATSGYVAKKINDIVSSRTIVSFDTFRQGGLLVATIICTT